LKKITHITGNYNETYKCIWKKWYI